MAGTRRQTSATTLRLARTFPVSRERVFKAWTTPQALKRWFAPADAYETPEVEVDLRVGGNYRIVMLSPEGERHTVYGEYREINPPKRLVFTWAWESWLESEETLVTVEFLERGGETELILTHQRFPNAEVREKHRKGWSGCLDRLPKAV